MNKKNPYVSQLFDFYAMELFNFYARPKIYGAMKGRIADKLWNNSVDELFFIVKTAMQYSCLRELRNFKDNTYGYDDCNGQNLRRYIRLNIDSDKINALFNKTMCEIEFVKGGNDIFHPTIVEAQRFINSVSFNLNWEYIKITFNNAEWEDGYGGEKWGKAAELLENANEPDLNKAIWIDTALDLCHNSGKLLNKSFLYSYFLGKQAVIPNQPRQKAKTYLNYRYHAKTIRELLTFSSNRVRLFIESNKDLLPKEIY